MSQPALRCVDLTKGFNGGPAVSNLNLEVNQGEVLALLGPSGCGKTTTLRLIAGFEMPDSGSIEVGGRLVAGPGTLVPPERRHIGMVFQDYALFPHLSVEENVAYGVPPGYRSHQVLRRSHRRHRLRRRDARVTTVLSLVVLSHLRSRMPHELSGGEQQLVALARALVPAPDILLLDEPFSNLDAKLRQQVREEVKEILEFSGVTALFVTHDQEEALYIGHRVAVLNEGHLEQVDTPEVVYQSPTTAFVAHFVGVADFLAVNSRDGILCTEAGPLPQTSVSAPQEGLEVMVRPDDVTFQPSESGQGRLISRMYQGAFTLYRILLDSGETVHSFKPNPEMYPIGTRVQVRLEPGHRLICYHEGKAIMDGGQEEPSESP